MRRWQGIATVLVGGCGAAGGTQAAAIGQPTPWQMGFQGAASPGMERIDSFHDLLLVLITLITLFVLGLLVYCMLKFNEKSNPRPSKTTHNTLVEVLWTAIPVVILVVIAVPSFKLLYLVDEVPQSEMTIKAIGNAWFWDYEYPDHGIAFTANMVRDKDGKPAGKPRLLETDNAVVVPVNTTVRVQTTSNDVIHAWAMPSLGVKKDAVPGRLNETWFKATKEGMYYGQCSELCGKDHGYMPIMLKVVSRAEFEDWVKKSKRADSAPPAATRLAEAARKP
ncbi:MAG: cytochrome c oxidase subunit II [Alphaproteobacteria bacterium]|nr:cytochrome c oxidase subunit II [Alphaproteobacteria bacterium]